MRFVAVFFIGLLFGFGILMSGMMNPAKVLNFFDVAGAWDPSLAFVMSGGLLVTFIGYKIVLKRPGPILAQTFSLPSKTDIDKPLIFGSIIFGMGWAISGFCPGAAIPALGTGLMEVFLFVLAMVVGLTVCKYIIQFLGKA